MRRRALLSANAIGGNGGGEREITFYIDDQVYTTPMKALYNMTWEEFVNSEYANQNSSYTNFRLQVMGTYNTIIFYHEEAMYDMFLYIDRIQNVDAINIIEEGKIYNAF